VKVYASTPPLCNLSFDLNGNSVLLRDLLRFEWEIPIPWVRNVVPVNVAPFSRLLAACIARPFGASPVN
jgi:hypothetical protein